MSAYLDFQEIYLHFFLFAKKRPTEVLFGLPNHPRVSCVSQNCNKDLGAVQNGLNREL